MTFLVDILSKDQLKQTYRNLAKSNHPDLGGECSVMQKINEEYRLWERGFSTSPRNFKEVTVGHKIYVNSSECIVTSVEEKCFKAKSLFSYKEAYFDKSTGYGLFNFNIRANISLN
ncbi:MAG: hypothetical protein A2033_05110 [Bacteroidetes bacterium GWA2_31_9]|nr:MAG: hypothetical protein A2033_05110 [Bacteroidetes bacterium GWA2_31_9]